MHWQENQIEKQGGTSEKISPKWAYFHKKRPNCPQQ